MWPPLEVGKTWLRAGTMPESAMQNAALEQAEASRAFPEELREVEIAVFKAFGLRPPRKWRATKRSEAR